MASSASPAIRWKLLAIYLGASFVLHLAWEMAQMPLFVLPEQSAWADFKMCLAATATGDMLFMLTLYLTVAVIHKDAWWLADRSAYAHPATWVVPILVGGLLAISFELWAVHAAHRWAYGAMPVIPVLRVGVSPLLQMIVIPPVTIGLCRWLASAAG